MLPPALLSKLKDVVARQNYNTTPDFHPNVIQVEDISAAHSAEEDVLVIGEFYAHMGKYFKYSGHVGTNIARMEPTSYISEHDDYGAAVYGTRQDSIIKLQIPIITTNRVGMMWRGDTTYPPTVVHMVEGGIYIIDNVKVHSVVNMGNEYRYNLTSRWQLDSVIDKVITNAEMTVSTKVVPVPSPKGILL